MRNSNKRTVLKSLSVSTLDRGGETALEAILKNLRIVGQALPRPEIYERARMAAVEAILKCDDGRTQHWLRFYFSLMDLASEAYEVTRRFSSRERNALQFIELIISDKRDAGARDV
jgi:alkylhydroperoxidase family enzyme